MRRSSPTGRSSPTTASWWKPSLTGSCTFVPRGWDGHPVVVLEVPDRLPESRPGGGAAHPSLLAAVKRYSDECPDHPREGVFCNCGWYGRGRDLIVNPWDLASETP